MSEIRHPTKKNKSNPPPSPPSISDGKEKLILEGLYLSRGKWFNQKDFSRKNKIPRTTIRDILSRLIDKGYCSKEGTGIYIITEKGKQIFDSLKGMTETFAGSGGRAEEKTGIFSTHYLKYTSIIKSKDNNWKEKLSQLNPNSIKSLNNKNNPQEYLYFDDCTIIISKKKIIVRIHDIINNDSEVALFESFNKALDKIEYCKKIGLICDNLILEDSHYARLNSYFAEQLEKIDNRYFIELDDKSKFWIDNSHENIEDETNNKELRDNIDSFIKYESKKDITDEFERMKQMLEETITVINGQAKHNNITSLELEGISKVLNVLVSKDINKEQPMNEVKDTSKPYYVG